MRTYPEINALTLPQVTAAIALGKANLAAVVPAQLPELFDRLAALEERKRRLVATARQIAKTQSRGRA